MMAGYVAIILAVIAGVGVLALLFRPLFDDFDGFWDCVCYWFKPDIFSMFDGDWMANIWAEMKLGFWFFCGGAVGFGVYAGIMKVMT